MNQYRYLTSVFNNELRQIFAYSVDFWVNFFGKMLTQVGVAFFLWGSIYKVNQAESMQGFSFKGIIIYFTLIPLLQRILQGANIGSISREIYEGGLNKYLVYPVNYYFYKITTYLAHSFIYLIQLILIYLIIYFIIGFPSEFNVTYISFTQGVLACLLGALVYFAMSSILELVSFWADNVWSLIVMLRFVVAFLGGAFIPLTFFPEWAQSIISYTPFYYLIHFPVSCFLGQTSPTEFTQGMAILVFWYCIFQWSSSFVFKRGSLRYTGIGI